MNDTDWIDKNLELLIDAATEWREDRNKRPDLMSVILLKIAVRELDRLVAGGDIEE